MRKGVNYEPGRDRYRARLSLFGKRFYLGYFNTQIEAEQALLLKEDELVRRFNSGYGRIGDPGGHKG